MMNSNSMTEYHNPHRWLVFSIVSMVYFFVYFHRVSTSVIVPDLLETFQTDAQTLGILSSMYFYLYALEQPLVGYLTDRHGPRNVMSLFTIIAAMGCFLFGISPNIEWASAGRALIGIGVGGVYIPALKSISQWFKKTNFSAMLGLLMSVGNLGAVVATTPLAFAAGTWGWRPTFFLIGTITLVLSILAFLFTKDHKRSIEQVSIESSPEQKPEETTRQIVLKILSSGKFWIISIIFFGIYGTVITLQGLWATPFLMTVLKVDSILASQLNMLIPIGVIIGAPFFGWLTERFELNKFNTLITILWIYTCTWITLVFFCSGLKITGYLLVLFVMGLAAGGFISTLWGIVRETTPVRIFGLTSGIINPFPFAGVAVFQVLTGWILDEAGRVDNLYPITGFKNAFTICLLGSIFCLGLSFLLRRKTDPITV